MTLCTMVRAAGVELRSLYRVKPNQDASHHVPMYPFRS